jgi:NTE family protein
MSRGFPRAADRRRVAVVLSGGGNLGAVQVGMLRALLEHGIVPDLVVGCSAGAINGAALAAEPGLDGIDRLAQLWSGLTRRQVMPRGRLPRVVAMARRGEAIHRSQGLRRLLATGFDGRRFEDLVLSFECAATDVVSGEQVWFNRGPLLDAVLASAAMPMVYPSVRIGGRQFLDGAIVDDVPVRRAAALGADTLYVLQAGSTANPRTELRRPLDVALHAQWIARKHRFERDLESLPSHVQVHLVPRGPVPTLRYDDFSRAVDLIDVGYHAATAYLDRQAGLGEIDSPGDVEVLTPSRGGGRRLGSSR